LLGFSKTFTICGTPLYTAPEIMFIVNTGHRFEVDYWSLEVVIYEMKIGSAPCYREGITQQEMDRRIVNANFDFPATSIVSITPSARDGTKKLLVANPARRLGTFKCTGTREIKSRK
jgi:serine/threonine protein kinase